MRSHRWAVLVVLAAVGLSSSTAAQALLTAQGVVVRRGWQYRGAATPAGAVIAYTQLDRGGTARLFLKTPGRRRVQVNKRGSAYSGGFDGTTLIYQSVRSGRKASNIRLYDLVTHVRSAPTGVNTAKWEYDPTISGGWILFGRVGRHRRVLLHNTVTSKTKQLWFIRNPSNMADVGQVNGDWAVWDVSKPSIHTSSVFFHQISTNNSGVIGGRAGRLQYAPSVSADGTIFYARSKASCGNTVVLRERKPGGADTLLFKLPPGRDVQRTYTVDEGAGVYSVYFDESNCNGHGADVYKLTVG